MSGVIDSSGQQWQRCNHCAKWVRIQDLMYEKPSLEYTHGRDLCKACAADSKKEVVKGETVTIHLVNFDSEE